mmetsp:Transcript_7324/g.30326  ORF Transcript_7324/g.30326 Transcript_7324/m.30326 type:complete len:115 (-) Transcript_7324:527-871(-)
MRNYAVPQTNAFCEEPHVTLPFCIPAIALAHTPFNASGRVPIARWMPDHSNKRRPSKLVDDGSAYGAFVCTWNQHCADLKEFKISPIEAMSMDPQQILLLEAAHTILCLPTRRT